MLLLQHRQATNQSCGIFLISATPQALLPFSKQDESLLHALLQVKDKAGKRAMFFVLLSIRMMDGLHLRFLAKEVLFISDICLTTF